MMQKTYCNMNDLQHVQRDKQLGVINIQWYLGDQSRLSEQYLTCYPLDKECPRGEKCMPAQANPKSTNGGLLRQLKMAGVVFLSSVWQRE